MESTSRRVIEPSVVVQEAWQCRPGAFLRGDNAHYPIDCPKCGRLASMVPGGRLVAKAGYQHPISAEQAPDPSAAFVGVEKVFADRYREGANGCDQQFDPIALGDVFSGLRSHPIGVAEQAQLPVLQGCATVGAEQGCAVVTIAVGRETRDPIALALGSYGR